LHGIALFGLAAGATDARGACAAAWFFRGLGSFDGWCRLGARVGLVFGHDKNNPFRISPALWFPWPVV
jgi:hypothetical protein